jgi:hypothetical protein
VSRTPCYPWVVGNFTLRLLQSDRSLRRAIAGSPITYSGSTLGLRQRKFADAMSPPVPSLAPANVQSYADGQLKWVITNGLWPSGMPASKGILTDDEMWEIIVYIRHLPPAASLGEPAMYSSD